MSPSQANSSPAAAACFNNSQDRSKAAISGRQPTAHCKQKHPRNSRRCSTRLSTASCYSTERRSRLQNLRRQHSEKEQRPNTPGMGTKARNQLKTTYPHCAFRTLMFKEQLRLSYSRSDKKASQQYLSFCLHPSCRRMSGLLRKGLLIKKLHLTCYTGTTVVLCPSPH